MADNNNKAENFPRFNEFKKEMSDNISKTGKATLEYSQKRLANTGQLQGNNDLMKTLYGAVNAVDYLTEVPHLIGCGINLGMDGVGVIAGGAIKGTAKGIDAAGDIFDKGASWLQDAGKEKNMLIKVAANLLAGVAKIPAVGLHVAASGINKLGDATQFACSMCGSGISALASVPSQVKSLFKDEVTSASPLTQFFDQVGSTASNTLQVLSEPIKTAGTQLVDFGNKLDIPLVSHAIRGGGRVVQAIGMIAEGCFRAEPSAGRRAASVTINKSLQSAGSESDNPKNDQRNPQYYTTVEQQITAANDRALSSPHAEVNQQISEQDKNKFSTNAKKWQEAAEGLARNLSEALKAPTDDNTKHYLVMTHLQATEMAKAHEAASKYWSSNNAAEKEASRQQYWESIARAANYGNVAQYKHADVKVSQHLTVENVNKMLYTMEQKQMSNHNVTSSPIHRKNSPQSNLMRP